MMNRANIERACQRLQAELSTPLAQRGFAFVLREQTDWTKPRYPGDAVRIALLRNGDELGDVRIQHYGENTYRVGSFLPGNTVCHPGDTPKVEPEQSEWRTDPADADQVFVAMVLRAFRDGWVEYRP